MRTAAHAAKLSRRQLTTARNRAVLLAAARQVFAAKGYGAASVRDIVRATDLASGTFYEYFDDKADVFAAVLSEAEREFVRAFALPRLDTSLPVAERVGRSYVAFYTFVADNPELFRLLEASWRAADGTLDFTVFARGVEDLERDLMQEGP